MCGEEHHPSVQFRDGASAVSNLSARRQRPTSLNLPSCLNLGLPKTEHSDVSSSIPKLHSSGPENCDFLLATKSQNDVLPQAINVSQPVIQRPSRLPVENPFGTLMNSIVHSPGHTPGHVLGIRDLCHQLENSSPVPGKFCFFSRISHYPAHMFRRKRRKHVLHKCYYKTVST